MLLVGNVFALVGVVLWYVIARFDKENYSSTLEKKEKKQVKNFSLFSNSNAKKARWKIKKFN